MNKAKNDLSAPFLCINDAARASGMSRDYIRKGVKSGKIPHVLSGKAYMINMRRFFDMLENESAESVKDGDPIE